MLTRIRLTAIGQRRRWRLDMAIRQAYNPAMVWNPEPEENHGPQSLEEER